MSIEIKVPTLPESVSDATIAKWYKNVGDRIERNENLVDLETDKVMLEVPSTAAGVIEKIVAPVGSTVKAGELIAVINESAAAAPKAEVSAKTEAPKENISDDLSPAVRRMVAEHNIDITQVKGSGKGGRITKEDIDSHLSKGAQSNQSTVSKAAPAAAMGAREDQRVPMSRLRARIAERLVEVQSQAALLTTFNEVDMKAVMDMRAQYKDKFEKMHGARLGFMSFFVKAVVEALKRFPIVNASIDGNDIVYHNYYDIGIAVSSPRGLVVPIIRNADQLTMAQIEQAIVDYANKAKDGKLEMEDMTGGTFTITNGGTFGSMMSTPIINPPQSAILGMHNIVKRPMVVNDEIVIRPMMYLALSYDHRIIDGRDSVGFLVTIKELIEDPARLILSV